jgi:hypothetical protein
VPQAAVRIRDELYHNWVKNPGYSVKRLTYLV